MAGSPTFDPVGNEAISHGAAMVLDVVDRPSSRAPAGTFDWLPESSEVYRAERVEGLLWRPAPHIFVTRVVGHADLGCVRFYVSRAQSAILAGHTIAVFHDWSRVTSYDRQARDRLRSFGAQNDDAFRGVYYLVSSKIIMMAISAAAVALGRRLFAYTDPEPFHAKLAEELREKSPVDG